MRVTAFIFTALLGFSAVNISASTETEQCTGSNKLRCCNQIKDGNPTAVDLCTSYNCSPDIHCNDPGSDSRHLWWKKPSGRWSSNSKSSWSGWNWNSKPSWSWSKPTNPPTPAPVNAWDSWGGKGPSHWVLNGWNEDAWSSNAWTGDGWGSKTTGVPTSITTGVPTSISTLSPTPPPVPPLTPSPAVPPPSNTCPICGGEREPGKVCCSEYFECCEQAASEDACSDVCEAPPPPPVYCCGEDPVPPGQICCDDDYGCCSIRESAAACADVCA